MPKAGISRKTKNKGWETDFGGGNIKVTPAISAHLLFAFCVVSRETFNFISLSVFLSFQHFFLFCRCAPRLIAFVVCLKLTINLPASAPQTFRPAPHRIQFSLGKSVKKSKPNQVE